MWLWFHQLYILQSLFMANFNSNCCYDSNGIDLCLAQKWDWKFFDRYEWWWHQVYGKIINRLIRTLTRNQTW